jgi:hypothetical protein
MQLQMQEPNDDLQPQLSASSASSASNTITDAALIQNNHSTQQQQHSTNTTALSSIFPKKKNQLQSQPQPQPQTQTQVAMQELIAAATASTTSPSAQLMTTNSVDASTANIDAVFGRIVEKYNSQIYTIIYNVLLQLHRNNDDSGGDYMHYINGLNQILQPINASIKKWIDENIVF